MARQQIAGGSCYTAHDIQDLTARIAKATGVPVKQIQGKWVYYLDLKAANAQVIQHVQQLLQLDSQQPVSAETNPNATAIYSTPRYISPWSSKATSIAHVCGMKESVARIERGKYLTVEFDTPSDDKRITAFRDILHDRMTEIFEFAPPSMDDMFAEGSPATLTVVDIFEEGKNPLEVLGAYNKEKGLSLDDSEMEYLVGVFTKLGRSPHDVELFMFAQVNSEYAPSAAYTLRHGLTAAGTAVTRSSTRPGTLTALRRTSACSK